MENVYFPVKYNEKADIRDRHQLKQWVGSVVSN